MGNYVKLFGSILDSTVWKLPAAVSKVWVTMMAMADRDGVVEASLPGLARRAFVSDRIAKKAIATFMAPDPDSKTPDNEGRRIELVPRGWRLLNYEAYRELQSLDDRKAKNAERQRRFRERHAADVTPFVTPSNAPSRSVTGSNASCSASVLSLSGSAPSEPQSRAPMRSNGEARPPLTGHALCSIFGQVRSRIFGGFPWQGVRVARGAAADMAEAINAESGARDDVEATIELLFRKAKAGELGDKSGEIIREPSFAFGAWISRWTPLREEIHGIAPLVPEAAKPRAPESFAVAAERARADRVLEERTERIREELKPRAPQPSPRAEYEAKKKAGAAQ